VKVQIKETDYAKSIELLKKGGYLSEEDTQSDIKVESILISETTNKKTCPFFNSENIGKKKR